MGNEGLFGRAGELPTAKLPPPSTDRACLSWLRNIRNGPIFKVNAVRQINPLGNQQTQPRRQQQATLIWKTGNYRRFLNLDNPATCRHCGKNGSQPNFSSKLLFKNKAKTSFFWIVGVPVFIFYFLIQISSSDKGSHFLWIKVFFLSRSTGWPLFKSVPSSVQLLRRMGITFRF